MGHEVGCTIDFRIDDTLSSVSALLGRLGPIGDTHAGDRVELDFSRCTYLGPFAAALVGSVILHSNVRGQVVRVVPPLEPKELRAFWNFSGLAELTSDGRVTSQMEPEKHPNLPLQLIEKAGFQAADPVIKLVHAQQELSDDWEEAIRSCVNEVVQNIQDHAESSIGGVMSARFMKKSSEIRVGIVDRGRGICTTLKKRFPDTSPGNALRRVIEGNYSALSRANNMGVGISNLASIITNLKGDFHLISETSTASSRGGAAFRFSSLSCRFSGTAVFLVLPYHDLRMSP